MLTAKQERFVSEYLVTGCGAESARRANYKARSAAEMAYENLRKPQIVAALAAKRAELATVLDIDRNVIIGGIFSAIEQARLQADAGQVIRGWVEVAKLTGLDKPDAAPVRRPSAENEALRMKLEAMTDAELADIASGRRAAP